MDAADPTPASQGGKISPSARESRFMLGLMRGLKRTCPNCGRGALYSRYISVQAQCAMCGHDNAQYRADDAGPYFTILVVGHLVIGPMLFSPFIWKAPIWLVLSTTLPTIAVLTLVLLPIIKGGVIGAQWAMKRDKDSPTIDAVEVVAVAPTADLEQV